jgi:hypothetical protein
MRKLFILCLLGFACAAAAALPPAAASLPVPAAARAIEVMPPITRVFTASREYESVAFARTNRAVWTDASGSVNFPQTVRIAWHLNATGEAVLQGRDAWDPQAPWRELGRWGRGTDRPRRGETGIEITRPTLLWLRVRAPAFPRSGIASLRAEFRRRTVAALRGPENATRRPVILAEGYDPFNANDWNDPGWQEDPTLAELVAAGRVRHRLDVMLLDWGDGGAPLQQQAADFAEIARQVRSWNGGRRETVAAGVSMGAVSLRYALAAAAGAPDGLGVRKYLSINGPHRGAWVNPDLLELLLERASDAPEVVAEETEAFLVRRGLNSPAAQQLVMAGRQHDAFYSELRALGEGGYDPAVPRVAFSNGTLMREGNELADFVEGRREVLHRISLRPLWLPVWLTFHRTHRQFRYGGYPGELLPADLRRPIRTHRRIAGIFRLDFRARWESVPTFIPTHSALDFPSDLEGGPQRFRYNQWHATPFPKVYVSRGRNLAHDETAVDWIDPRTAQRPPSGQNAVLYEIAQAFVPGG